MNAHIDRLKADLEKAHESGDEATNELRQQLQRALEERVGLQKELSELKAALSDKAKEVLFAK